MKDPIQNEEEKNTLEKEPTDIAQKNEVIKEKEKPTPIAIPNKVSRVPNFPNANMFGRWNNNTNNRQRPGRAASRWR